MRRKQTQKGGDLMKKETIVFVLMVAGLMLIPELGFASVESSLMGMQMKLTRVILPVLSVIGIAWAAFSFITGHENAKKHILYAVLGSALGFGAQAIVDFISQTVQ
jgi:hypothetical protein